MASIYYIDDTRFGKKKNKTDNYDPAVVEDLASRAVQKGVPPNVVLGTGLKETNLGKYDEMNPLRVHQEIHKERLAKKFAEYYANEPRTEAVNIAKPRTGIWGKIADFIGMEPPVQWNFVPREIDYKKIKRNVNIDTGIELIKENLARSKDFRTGLRKYNWNAPSDVDKTIDYGDSFSRHPDVKVILDRVARPRR